jgi:hypothetical protein
MKKFMKNQLRIKNEKLKCCNQKREVPLLTHLEKSIKMRISKGGEGGFLPHSKKVNYFKIEF